MIALLSLQALFVLLAAVDAKILSGSGTTFMYLQLDGQVFGHGRTQFGSLGTSFQNSATILFPTAMANINNATDVVVRETHSCVVDQGAAKCSGQNAGRLGNGGTTNSWLAFPAVGLEQDVVEVFATSTFSFAILSNGTGMGWGPNANGQLLDSTTVTTLVPVQILGGMPLKQIVGLSTSSCALTVSGKVYCAGDNGNGNLGDNTTVSRVTPELVQGLDAVTASIAGGRTNHMCALNMDGLVRCWGRNDYGAIGAGVAPPNIYPLPIIPLGLESLVVDELVASEKATFFILKSDRSVLVAGETDQNAFGTGSAAKVKYYTAIPFANGVTGIRAVAGGELTTCVFDQALDLWCVGDSNYYQTGQGDKTDLSVLTRVQNMATRAPSASPTLSPTLTPTMVPTPPTTAAPTAAPSAAPTLAPTLVPTPPTSAAPSTAPTTPTLAPTAAPTLAPVDGTSAPAAGSSNAPSTSAAAAVVPGVIATSFLLLAF